MGETEASSQGQRGSAPAEGHSDAAYASRFVAIPSCYECAKEKVKPYTMNVRTYVNAKFFAGVTLTFSDVI